MAINCFRAKYSSPGTVLDEVTVMDIEQEVEIMTEAYHPNDFGGGFIARHYPQSWDTALPEEKQKAIYHAFMANGCSLDNHMS